MNRMLRFSSLLAAPLLCSLAAAPALAWPVFDAPHTALTSANVAGQAAKWGQEIQHLGREIAHWHSQIQYMQSQLFALQSMGLASQIALQDQFRKRPDNYGMATTCARNESAGMDTLWRVFIPNLDGSLAEQQQALCVRIVLAENAKYNATVDLLQQLRDRDRELDSITSQRRNISSGQQGNLAANSNQIDMFATNLQMDLQRWETTIIGYNNHIESLKSEQLGISRRAFNGTPSPLGTVMGTITLKAAIDALR